MIKEYFTDGLIGLAILLSLFRTDLTGINNLINYPEVQDIILGQTAAYLPANFHHIHNTQHAFANPKHLDFDNQAFNAWYQNINNLPLFRERGQNEIEAFLVSGSHQNIVGQQFQNDHTTNDISESDVVPQISSPTLPVESANSFTVTVVNGSNSTSSSERTNSTVSTSVPVASGLSEQPLVVDVSFLFNGPFPGCNLTKEDLELIDVLWRQDVDLGVGKEVFDHSLREELERERELEVQKQQERQKAQLLAKEKEEKEKQEQRERYLAANFRRDGETGEWVRRQNETDLNGNLAPDSFVENTENNDFPSLEAALDFLQNLEVPQASEPYNNFSSSSVQEMQGQQYEIVPQQQQQQQQIQLQQQQPLPFVEHQDSLEESWNGLVDYLNMAANSEYENVDNTAASLPQSAVEMNTSMTLNSDLNMGQDINLQSEYLIQNATLPSAGLDFTNDFTSLTPVNEVNTSMPLASANMNSSMDFDLGDLNFFDDLTTLQNTSVDDLDLTEVDDLFRTIQGTNNAAVMETTMSLGESMDAIQMLEDNLSSSAVSMGSASPHGELSEVFDTLEGATGGSDYTGNHGDMNGRFSKVSRFSESSNDSGIGFQGGSSSSSASSSYAGSPSGTHNGVNGTTSSNDTEHDPHGTRAVAQHHVAHNHTYNTPPGQVPREVKKYAQKEPSRKGPHSRDQRRAEELKVPFTIDEIIESPVETFNEMITSQKLTEAQITLIRDIRRRGKNKVAAQNCRKRKVNVIVGLSDEMTDLQKARDRLVAERAVMERETRKMKEKFGHLYTHIFQSLRDERGEPYDPNLYSLQQSSDGNVFLVPRNVTVNNQNSSSSSASSSPSSSKDSTGSKKRKSHNQ